MAANQSVGLDGLIKRITNDMVIAAAKVDEIVNGLHVSEHSELVAPTSREGERSFIEGLKKANLLLEAATEVGKKLDMMETEYERLNNAMRASLKAVVNENLPPGFEVDYGKNCAEFAAPYAYDASEIMSWNPQSELPLLLIACLSPSELEELDTVSMRKHLLHVYKYSVLRFQPKDNYHTSLGQLLQNQAAANVDESELDQIKLACLIDYLAKMLKTNEGYGRGYAQVSCLLARLYAIHSIPTDFFLESIDREASGCSLLEAAGLLRLNMVARHFVSQQPSGVQHDIPRFEDSRFKNINTVDQYVWIKDMPNFLVNTCEKEITGRTVDDPWFTIIRDDRNIVQAVIVVENNVSCSWLRLPNLTPGHGSGWLLTEETARIVELNTNRSAGMVEWTGKNAIWPDEIKPYRLPYRARTPFSKYLGVFDLVGYEREAAKEFDGMKERWERMRKESDMRIAAQEAEEAAFDAAN